MRKTLFNQQHYLTDGGLETTLIFHEGIELTHFAAFELLNTNDGRNTLNRYYKSYITVAQKYNAGFILETPTWRANPDWGNLLGYSSKQLDAINQSSVAFLKDIKNEMENVDMLISGCLGPRGDGYIAANKMSADDAATYHHTQLQSFADAGVDLVTAMTLNYAEEALGITQAARDLRLPVVISFTVETDGKLPDGEWLSDAIQKVDLATDGYVSHYMINCAHPDHFINTIDRNQSWANRIKGVRANASTKSHAELNESSSLDTGDKGLLADRYMQLMAALPDLRVIGGCCGTDHTHIELICKKIMGDTQFPS